MQHHVSQTLSRWSSDLAGWHYKTYCHGTPWAPKILCPLTVPEANVTLVWSAEVVYKNAWCFATRGFCLDIGMYDYHGRGTCYSPACTFEVQDRPYSSDGTELFSGNLGAT